MSDGFITELEIVRPVVLVVGDPSALTVAVEQIFSKAQLEVEAKTLVDFFTSPLDKTYYKVVFITNSPAQAEKIVTHWADHLTDRPESWLLLVRVPTLIVASEAPLSNWATTTQEVKNLITLAIKTTRGKIVLLENVLIDITSTILEPLLSDFHHEQVIYNPLARIRALSLVTCQEYLQQIVVHPRLPAVVWIRGVALETSELASVMQRDYYQFFGVTLKITVVPTTVLNELSGVKVFSAPESKELVVEALHHITRQLPSKVARPKAHSHSVVSGSLPEPHAIDTNTENKSKTVHQRARNSEQIETAESTAENTLVEPISLMAESAAIPAPVASQPPSPPTPPPTNIDQAVFDLFSEYRVDHKVSQLSNTAQQTLQILFKLKRRKRLFYSGVGLVCFMALVAVMMGVFLLSLINTKRDFIALLQPAQVEAPSTASSAPTPTTPSSTTPSSKWAKTLISQSNFYLQFIPLNNFDQARQLGQTVLHLATTQDLVTKWQQNLSESVLQLVSGQTTQTPESWKVISTQAQAAYEQLSLIQAELKNIDESIYFSNNTTTFSQYKEQMADNRKALAAYQQVAPQLTAWLGYQKPRVYAVLLQNHQELRPTGGFLQAVALVTVNQGTITDWQVLSIYDLDSRLVGSIQPPEEITRLLGEKNWFVRDSNWNPHFPTTALQVSWFLERVLDKKIDGVIGFNDLVLQELLTAVGPLELPEFNEVITNRNLNERLEFHSEIQFSPSQFNQDYTTLLWTKLFKKLSTLQPAQVPKLLEQLNTSFLSQDAMMVMTVPGENESLNTLGWTGALATPQCPAQLATDSCVVDTIAQVEANIGINKANYQLQRSTTHTVELKPGVIKHTRQVVWQNQATSNAWPKGPYKAYTRFYLPIDAQLGEVRINKALVPTNNLTERTEQGRKVVGVVSETPIQQTTTLDLVYSRPLPHQSTFSYVFFDQKQAGIGSRPLNLTLVPDPIFQPTIIAPQAELVGSVIRFAPDANQHAFVGVQFR